MRRLLTALTLVAGCAFAQHEREALDTAQEILQTRPYNFRALLTELSLVTSVQPAPTPADLDAALKAAVLLISAPNLVFTPANKPQDMTEVEWANAKDESQSLADRVLIAIDRLRNTGTKPVSQEPLAEVTSIRKIEAEYSEEGRLAGLEGSVMVSGTVAGDGSIHDLRVTRPLGLGLDEQALAAAAQWQFQLGSPQLQTLEIDFALPSKQSRWHLVRVEFKTPEGTSRPTFAATDYPAGPGIGFSAYDEARILAAIGRGATATVSFDIDENGNPGHFQVVSDSLNVWGPEAIMVVEGWHFHPAMKAGRPVSVPCTLSLVWGPEDFTSRAISSQVGLMYSPTPSESARLVPLADSAILSKREPEYTDQARKAGIEGTVPISIMVGSDGKPASLRLGGGIALGMGLEESALDAVREWRFQPPSVNGYPTTFSLQVQVHFGLSGVESSVFVAPPTPVKAAPKAEQ